MLTCLVHVLFTFYIQGVLKLKKNNSGVKSLKYDQKRGPSHEDTRTFVTICAAFLLELELFQTATVGEFRH